jgi:hypothetical protein
MLVLNGKVLLLQTCAISSYAAGKAELDEEGAPFLPNISLTEGNSPFLLWLSLPSLLLNAERERQIEWNK